MKVLLYFEGRKVFARPGMQRAFQNQKSAIEKAGFEVTTDPKANDYDILHLNTYGVTSLVIARKAKRLGKKLVVHAHSTEEDFRNSFRGSNELAPAYKKYLTTIYKLADLVIAPSQNSQTILTEYGIEAPIHVISNGIHLPQYQPNPMKEQAFRDIFGISHEEKLVIGAGGYYERKGIRDFVAMANALPDYRFIWFGGKSALHLSTPSIRKIVKKDHPDNLEFSGYIKGDILEGAFSAADCFFFPSYEEREGIVVLEALASKQKVVVRDIPAYEPWLVDGVNCLKGKDVSDFKEKIVHLVEDEHHFMRHKAYETAKERSIPKISEELKTAYLSLV